MALIFNISALLFIGLCSIAALTFAFQRKLIASFVAIFFGSGTILAAIAVNAVMVGDYSLAANASGGLVVGLVGVGLCAFAICRLSGSSRSKKCRD